MLVYIKKYRGTNYFRERNIVDHIELSSLPNASFPQFRFETEDLAGTAKFRGGDFDIIIKLDNTTLSSLGVTLREFFLGEIRRYYYLVILKIGNMYYAGTARQAQIGGDLTYSQGKKEVRISCKDILHEWANHCETIPNSTITMGNEEQLTFEQYIYRHFSGVTSGVVLLGLPSGTYLNRLQPYGSPQSCYARGNYLNAIQDQINISRWETFKELAKGIGFNFEMYCNPGSEQNSEPEFIFQLFFINDLINETPITIKIIEHREITTAPRMEYLYIKDRYIKFAEGEYSNGIIFNSEDQYIADSDNSAEELYPAIFAIINGKVLRYTTDGTLTLVTVLKDVDFTELELKQYTYDIPIGAEQGKLYPLNETGVISGGMSYASIFSCHSVINGSIDHYDHRPINRYAALNYKRYLDGENKAKNFLVKYENDATIKNWKVFNGDDGHGSQSYYISAINKIVPDKKQIEIDAILLPN